MAAITPHLAVLLSDFVCFSPQHAWRLITQLRAFDGFPRRFREILQDEGVLPTRLEMFRCPINLEPLSFEAFQTELLNPTHGKSTSQVGHLNPLKLEATAAEYPGHTADNISWISEHGNRIQGSLSLKDVRSLLILL